jgi:GDP-L-fucose synthase
MVGKRLGMELRDRGYKNTVNHDNCETDPRNKEALTNLFSLNKPEYVFLLAGKSGGIQANLDFPAELMIDNLLIACNVIEASQQCGVKRLLYLSSSCTYPKHCRQPMQPKMLMTGNLEETNESYAIAKLSGMQLCTAYRKQYGSDFISVVPANTFGPGDDFGENNSHVISSLIRKIHTAKIIGAESVNIWGTGAPRREFIFVDDVVDGCIFVMGQYSGTGPINLGSSIVKSIAEVGGEITKEVGYEGKLIYDPSRPDGMLEKTLNSEELFGIGWRPKYTFSEAIKKTYHWYRTTID